MFYEPISTLLDPLLRVQLQKRLDDAYVVVGLQMTVSGSGKYTDKPSDRLRAAAHLTNHQSCEETVSQHFLDVVTIFLSPTDSVRKISVMPVLKKSGTSPVTTAAPLLKEGVTLQYVAGQEDDYVAKFVEEDHKD